VILYRLSWTFLSQPHWQTHEVAKTAVNLIMMVTQGLVRFNYMSRRSACSAFAIWEPLWLLGSLSLKVLNKHNGEHSDYWAWNHCLVGFPHDFLKKFQGSWSSALLYVASILITLSNLLFVRVGELVNSYRALHS